MPPKKQDWSPRGIVLERCSVTLEYDQLIQNFPAALELLNELIHDSDPKNLINDHDLSPNEAQREAERFHRLVEGYRRKEWWYVRVFAHALVPSLDPGARHMVRVGTSGDILESNWPPHEITVIELSELMALHEQLQEKGYRCVEFHVLRLGAFTLQHPKAPREETFFVNTKTWRRSKGSR